MTKTSKKTPMPQCVKTDVSGSFFNIFDTIHDNLIDKGFDCFNLDGSAKEVDEYKLTFKVVSDELKKHCLKTKLETMLKNKLVVNGFEIYQNKNSEGKYLPPNFLQWSAKDLFSDLIFQGESKKECVSWAENYR